MEIVHDASPQDGRLADLVNQVVTTLRRRWFTFIVVAAVVFVAGVVGVLNMTPKYTSVTRIQLDPLRNPLATNTNSTDQLSSEAIETEVTLLSSVDLARNVVRRLHLQKDPEFTGRIQGVKGAAMSPEEREIEVAGDLLRHLSVQREKLTYILDVSFTSVDSLKSARIANAFGDAYLETKVGSGTDTAQRQADFFKQRLDALGNEVRSADNAAAQYRAQAGIVRDSNGNSIGTIVDQQVAPLSNQMAMAESDASAAHARLDAARGQIASGGIESVSAVLSSPVIGDLRRQRAEVQRSVDEVLVRYGEKHPEYIRVRDQLAALDKQITAEANRVVDSLKSDASAADARVNSLKGSMGELRTREAQDTRASVMADTLQHDADTKRTAYDRMSQMSLNSTEATKNSIAQAEIVQQASPLQRPTSPNKPLLIALAFVVALTVAGTVIAVQEMMVAGMRTVEELEAAVGVPVVAAVPAMDKSSSPDDILLDRPTSLFAESLRIARAAILGVRGGNARKVIAITSALPSEGKTTTALAFARTLALNNAKTLLIECDVRRAQMRFHVRNVPQGPGLIEVLHGEAKLHDAITPGDVPKLDHLLVKAPYFSSENLFGENGMESIIAEMREEYDQIVLDLPPLVGLADGRYLAVLADAVALIVKWDSTPADAAASAIGWLRADGANPVGAIFTMVDQSAAAIGGIYYSKKYSAYYKAA